MTKTFRLPILWLLFLFIFLSCGGQNNSNEKTIVVIPKGTTHVFIPLKGFSFPDREGLPHWDPEGNQAFVDALKEHLRSDIPLTELNAHINDPDFIDPVVETFFAMMKDG